MSVGNENRKYEIVFSTHVTDSWPNRASVRLVNKWSPLRWVWINNRSEHSRKSYNFCNMRFQFFAFNFRGGAVKTASIIFCNAQRKNSTELVFRKIKLIAFVVFELHHESRIKLLVFRLRMVQRFPLKTQLKPNWNRQLETNTESCWIEQTEFWFSTSKFVSTCASMRWCVCLPFSFKRWMETIQNNFLF